MTGEDWDLAHKTVSESLALLIAELDRVDRDLARLTIDLPEPVFEAGTDRPLNAAARIYGLLCATRQDDLTGAIHSLRQALELSDSLELSESLELSDSTHDSQSADKAGNSS